MKQGIKELVLIAQDTTRYGVELDQSATLASLLRGLAAVDGIEWVRALYAYPTTVTDEVLEVMATRAWCLPLPRYPTATRERPYSQGDERPGTRASNEKLLERIRCAVPRVSLRSSFIVGFPGETRADFEELLQFCRDMELDNVGVFTYSNEENTEAFVQIETVPSAEKEKRRHLLMKQQGTISLRKNHLLVGTRQKVLVEGPSPETDLLLRGRTEGQAPEIDGGVLINEGTASPGDL